MAVGEFGQLAGLNNPVLNPLPQKVGLTITNIILVINLAKQGYKSPYMI
jgi:hypothetical protein